MAAAALALLTCQDNFEPSDPCEGVTCSGRGECFDDGHTAVCICHDGFHPEGLECVADGPDGDADSDVDLDDEALPDAAPDADDDGVPDADSDADADRQPDGDTDRLPDGEVGPDAEADGTDAEAWSCPCHSGVDNFCMYEPSTPDCPMTWPGGYCDPNGDGAYDDADFTRGYFDFSDHCG